MKLWKIYQDENNDYDTYDSAVVAAQTEDEARGTHPSDVPGTSWGGRYSSWCSAPENVGVIYLGEAKEGTDPGVIVASFNAG